ncbi:putative NET domain-containing protein [Helianthus anomalus]
MSEISRDTDILSEMDMKIDFFQYYIHGIRELLSRDDLSPSSLTDSRLVKLGSGKFRNSEVEKEDTGCNERNRPVGFSPLFCNAVGNGVSGYRKDRLVTLLRQSVVALNGEVDEVMDPVLSMLRLRRLLAPEKHCASDGDANDKIEFEERERKRLKSNEPLNASSGNLTEEGSLSEKKGVVEFEPDKRKSLKRCNTTGCGKFARKRNFDETKSLCADCSKHGMNESLLGSSSKNDNENGEVDDTLQVLLENRGPKLVEKLENHSAEISAMLERMKEKLEELVDIVVSSCRAMSLVEKHQLSKMVQNLDPENLDRIVEIIQQGKPPEKQSRDDIIVDLQNEDHSTLWRIYFHVKAAENARKLL